MFFLRFTINLIISRPFGNLFYNKTNNGVNSNYKTSRSSFPRLIEKIKFWRLSILNFSQGNLTTSTRQPQTPTQYISDTIFVLADSLSAKNISITRYQL